MLAVPAFKQSDDSRCGPAAVKSVLAFYGIQASEDELCVLTGHTYEKGCEDVGMKRAAESFGLSCEIYNNQTLDDLRYWIRHQIPVIVDWFTCGINPHLEDTPEGHAGVIVDIDDERVYLLDPESGTIRKLLHEDFMRAWFDWRGRQSTYITSWDDMVIRQSLIIYPPGLSAVGPAAKPKPKAKTGPSL
jgi:predicted double-glycine peptidase